MKPITPQKTRSKIMASAIDSLDKRRRDNSQTLSKSIKEAKAKNKEAQKRIKEIAKEISEDKEELAKLKTDYLELSDKEQLDRAIAIQRIENRLESLTKAKNRLPGIIESNKVHIKKCLAQLDNLRKEEFKARKELAVKHEAKIAAEQGRDAVVKLIKRRFIEPLEKFDAFTVEDLKDKPAVIKEIEEFMQKYGLPFPNRVLDAFPESETKDFPADLFESVRKKLLAVRALRGVRKDLARLNIEG